MSLSFRITSDCEDPEAYHNHIHKLHFAHKVMKNGEMKPIKVSTTCSWPTSHQGTPHGAVPRLSHRNPLWGALGARTSRTLWDLCLKSMRGLFTKATKLSHVGPYEG